MKRRALIAAAAVVVLAALAWFAFSPREQDPIYDGKPLTVWMRDYLVWHQTAPTILGARPPGRTNADKAVRAVGADAVPLLLRMLHTRDSAFKTNLAALARKFHVASFQPVPAASQKIMAIEAIAALGPEARSAVPGLLDIYKNGPDRDSRCEAADALGSIGPEARAVIPLLIQNAADPQVDLAIRIHSVSALGRMRAEPAVVIPALVGLLANDKPYFVQDTALSALGNFGADAKPALPVLFDFLKKKGPNQLVLNSSAAAAIRVIDPQVAYSRQDEIRAATTKSP